MGMALIAKYPFISTLLDSVTGASATFTRSTIQTYIKDDGTVATAAIDAPAYTGSGILHEPAATNISTYSIAFNSWTTKARCTIADGTITSPDGTLNASRMTTTDATTSGFAVKDNYATQGAYYYSVFAKKVDCDYIFLGSYYDGTAAYKWFNIANGTVGGQVITGTGASVNDAGIVSMANGWYFCWCKVTMPANTNSIFIAQSASNATTNSGGIGVRTDFFQYDIKSNLTSPITTTTTALTRTAPVHTISAANAPVSDFSYYVKYKPTVLQANATYIFIEYVDANNVISVNYNTGTGKYELNVIAGGVTRQAQLTYTPVVNTETEFLVNVSPTFIKLTVEGSSVTETAAGAPMTHGNITLYDTGTLFTVPENNVMSYFKIINSSNVTLAQAAALGETIPLNWYWDMLSTLTASAGYVGALVRSTIKTFITDAGAVSQAAINAPSYTGSGVLLEPAATNRLLYSQQFNNASWNKLATSTVTSNSLAAPDGTTTADTLVAVGTGGAYLLQSGFTAGTRYFSVFAKKLDNDYIELAVGDGATKDARQWFNISTGAVGSTTTAGSGASINDKGIVALADGWYFCWAKVTIDTTYNFLVIGVLADALTSSTNGHRTYVWQADDKENLSSPIITTTTALTRTVDALTVPTTGMATSGFSYYIEYTPKQNVTDGTILFNYSDANNYISLKVGATSFTLTVVIGGTSKTTTVNVTPVVGTTHKILVRISSATMWLDVDNTVTPNSIAAPIVNGANIELGYRSGSNAINGVINEFKYIEKADNITIAEAEDYV